MSKSTETSPMRDRPAPATLTFPKLWLELAVAVGLLAVAIYYVVGALALPRPGNPADVGPGALPLLIGVGTLAALAMLFVRIAVDYAKGEAGPEIVITRAVRVGLSVLVLGGTALLFERLGVVPVTFGSAALLMLLAGERRPLVVLLTAGGLTAAIYALFVLTLGVRFY